MLVRKKMHQTIINIINKITYFFSEVKSYIIFSAFALVNAMQLYYDIIKTNFFKNLGIVNYSSSKMKIYEI